MKPLSILLVEEDALIGAVLAEMLAGLGYETARFRRPRKVLLPRLHFINRT